MRTNPKLETEALALVLVANKQVAGSPGQVRLEMDKMMLDQRVAETEVHDGSGVPLRLPPAPALPGQDARERKRERERNGATERICLSNNKVRLSSQ